MTEAKSTQPQLPPRPERYEVEFRDCSEPSAEGTHGWTRRQRDGMKQFALRLLAELAQAEAENESLKAQLAQSKEFGYRQYTLANTETARAQKYEAQRVKMLEVIREYIGKHYCVLYEGHGGCSTCIKADALLTRS